MNEPTLITNTHRYTPVHKLDDFISEETNDLLTYIIPIKEEVE